MFSLKSGSGIGGGGGVLIWKQIKCSPSHNQRHNRIEVPGKVKGWCRHICAAPGESPEADPEPQVRWNGKDEY